MRWGKKEQWVILEKFVIGPDSDPYMIRWRLFECPWFRVFFHRILRDDNDRHLHDHPFNFVSLIVNGGYVEHTPSWHVMGETVSRTVKPLSIVRHRATDLHRLSLLRRKVAVITNVCKGVTHVGEKEIVVSAWTLVFAGRRLREWGFNTERGWISWKDYQEAW